MTATTNTTATMFMNPATGSVAPESEWREEFANTTPEMWGGTAFEDAGLVEVIKDENGDWIEA